MKSCINLSIGKRSFVIGHWSRKCESRIAHGARQPQVLRLIVALPVGPGLDDVRADLRHGGVPPARPQRRMRRRTR